VSVGAIGLALADLAGKLRRPWQCDIETPQRWVYQGPLAWPIKNGLSLGFGGFTRLGFALWYVIPLGVALSGWPAYGAAVWGAYGLLRTGIVVVVWQVGTHRRDFRPAEWLLGQNSRARVIASTYLLLVGLVTMLVVGL
jgi:hypothetical protein